MFEICWAFLEFIFRFYGLINLFLQGGWSLQSRFSAASKDAIFFGDPFLAAELVAGTPQAPHSCGLYPLYEVMVMSACAMQITGGSPRVSAEPVPVYVACR